MNILCLELFLTVAYNYSHKAIIKPAAAVYCWPVRTSIEEVTFPCGLQRPFSCMVVNHTLPVSCVKQRCLMNTISF
jgi:hypothetical protein